MPAPRTRTPRRIGGMARVPSTALAERLDAVRATTLRLAAPLSAEDCALQSMPDASPVKWHLAHTTWFFETFLLERYARGYRPFDPRYRVLFNSYYNAVGAQHPRPERGLLSRPSLDEVRSYRAHVESHLGPLLARADHDADVASLLELGLQHEQQHQELILTDLKHLLSRNPLQPAYRERWPLTAVKPRRSCWIGFGGGMAAVGHQGAGFCFDNEEPRHHVFLNPFEVASQPVTHGDFLAFIDDGGYTRPELWLSLGWEAVQAQRWTAPMYWERAGWPLDDVHAPWPRRDRPRHAHGARELLRSRRVRALGRGAPADRVRVGGGRARSAPSTGTSQDSGALHPLAPRADPPDGRPGQLFGDVWEWTAQRLRALSRLRGRRRARSASTTASSCAISTCCVAARAPRRGRTSAQPTGTSFRPKRAGSFPACASRAMRADASPFRWRGTRRSPARILPAAHRSEASLLQPRGKIRGRILVRILRVDTLARARKAEASRRLSPPASTAPRGAFRSAGLPRYRSRGAHRPRPRNRSPARGSRGSAHCG